MRNPSLYVGFTLISEEADGHKRVSTFDGISYQGLDDLQATMIQDYLATNFGARFDALKQEMREGLVEMGYAAVQVTLDDSGQPMASASEVDKVRGLAKGKGKGLAGTGNR